MTIIEVQLRVIVRQTLKHLLRKNVCFILKGEHPLMILKDNQMKVSFTVQYSYYQIISGSKRKSSAIIIAMIIILTKSKSQLKSTTIAIKSQS